MTYKGHTAGGILTAIVLAPHAPGSGVGVLLAGAALLIGSLAPDLDEPGSYLGRRAGPLPYLLRWMVSNPLTWWWAGRRRASATDYQRVRAMGRLRAALLTPLFWVLGRPRLDRLRVQFSVGRKRMRSLTRHRAVFHSLPGLIVGSTLFLLASHWVTIAAEARVPGVREGLLAGATGWLTFVPAEWQLDALLAAGFLAGCLSHVLLDATTVSGVQPLLPFSEWKLHLLPKQFRYRTPRPAKPSYAR